jgi:predicted Ser/Thr protein kinase
MVEDAMRHRRTADIACAKEKDTDHRALLLLAQIEPSCALGCDYGKVKSALKKSLKWAKRSALQNEQSLGIEESSTIEGKCKQVVP